MYVTHFSYVWSPESSHIWERASDSVSILSVTICLLTSLYVVTSFPRYIVGGVWGVVVSVPDRCPLQTSCF